MECSKKHFFGEEGNVFGTDRTHTCQCLFQETDFKLLMPNLKQSPQYYIKYISCHFGIVETVTECFSPTSQLFKKVLVETESYFYFGKRNEICKRVRGKYSIIHYKSIHA